MPMITLPTPLAALAYTAVKVVGYAEFARVFNRIIRLDVSPYKFGAIKTAFGLMGSVGYFLLILLLSALLSVFGSNGPSTTTLFLGAIPVRFLVWSFVLDRYYSSRMTPKLLLAATGAGVAWSYALDGVMWLAYQVFPGLVVEIPFC